MNSAQHQHDCPCRHLWRDPDQDGVSLQDQLYPPIAAPVPGSNSAQIARRRPRLYFVRNGDDEAAVTASAIRAARRDPSVAVCNPTPGISTMPELHMDILIGLGKDRSRLLAAMRHPETLQEWVSLWLRAHQIRHLILLRADSVLSLGREILLPPLTDVTIWLVSTMDKPVVEGTHPISAATFCEHWGCPHPTDDDSPTEIESPARSQDLPALRLYTLPADLRRHYPSQHVELLRDTLKVDLAEARAMLGRLQMLASPEPGAHKTASRDYQNAARDWPPTPVGIADPASLAAAMAEYFTKAGPAQPGQALRLRAMQLALLQHGWVLGVEQSAGGPIICTSAWATVLTQLTDARRAGYLALAYATGLPPTVLAKVGDSDLRPDGHQVVLDNRLWSIPSDAVVFIRALRLAGVRPLSAHALEGQVRTDAAELGLPAPPLPNHKSKLGQHPWFAGQHYTLAPMPRVIVRRPDPLVITATHWNRDSFTGAVVTGTSWP